MTAIAPGSDPSSKAATQIGRTVIPKTLLAHGVITTLGILLVVAIGIAVRFERYFIWAAQEPNLLLGSYPILANVDGYFYLLLARDLYEGIYHHLPSLLVFPDLLQRPSPAPLLSQLAAHLSVFVHQPVERVATLIPPVLGASLAIPLYFIGRELEDRITGFAAALFGVLIPYFIYRSALGWFDTDPLNVVLPLALSGIAITAIMRPLAVWGYVWLGCLYVFLGVLFLYWWDQAPHIVLLLSIFPVLMVLILRWSHRGLRYGSIVVTLGLLLIAGIPLAEIVSRSLGSLGYVTVQGRGIFPIHGVAIGEQQPLGYPEAATLVTGGTVMAALAFIGFLVLLVRRRFALLPLVPFLVVGAMGIFLAERFLIFLAPIVALGLAGSLTLIRDHVPNPLGRMVRVVALAIMAAALLVAKNDWEGAPIVRADLIEQMQLVSANTEPNAVLWNWCDYGYPLSYWSRRATLCDGASHTGEMRMYGALPLFADNHRYGANLIHFYVYHGREGMRRILDRFDGDLNRARGFIHEVFSVERQAVSEILSARYPGIRPNEASEWLDFLFPKQPRPVYLVLDRQTMRVTHWWHWFATWDQELRDGVRPRYILFHDLKKEDGRFYNVDGLAEIDTDSGIITFRGNAIRADQIRLFDEGGEEALVYGARSGWIMDIASEDGFAALHDGKVDDTLAHQLYVQRRSSAFFEPVQMDGARFQLWRVNHPESVRGIATEEASDADPAILERR